MNIFKHKESTMTKGITKFFMDAALFAGVASADTDLITSIMEQQGKLYRQVWGKVTEEILSQYRTTAQNLNYARRLGMW